MSLDTCIVHSNQHNRALQVRLLDSLIEYILVGHPEPEKKNSVGIFEYILASMLKVYLDVF